VTGNGNQAEKKRRPSHCGGLFRFWTRNAFLKEPEMPVYKRTAKETQAILGAAVIVPAAKKPSKMVVRTATEEDYRLRAVATIGTFFRAKDMKPK
jgi:hypothetical protein